MRRSSKILIAALAAVLVASGVAFAAWLVTGDGSGAAKAATVTIEVTDGQATASGDLYPGGTASLRINVENTSGVDLWVTDVVRKAAEPITSSNETDCSASNVSFADQTALSGKFLDPSAGAVEVVVDGVSLAANAPNGCQGVVFGIPVTVTASTSDTTP